MFYHTTSTIDVDEVVSAIIAGEFDKDFGRISDAVNKRLELLRKMHSVDDFNIGESVVINSLCGTAYIRGLTATIVDKTRKKLVIKLDKPVGRFIEVVDGITQSAEVSVPPSIVDHA